MKDRLSIVFYAANRLERLGLATVHTTATAVQVQCVTNVGNSITAQRRKMIKHIRQPEASKLCGQTCVAMICGITLQDSILAFGHSKGTRTIEIIRALKKYGVEVIAKRGNSLWRVRKKESFPLTGIYKVVPTKGSGLRGSHWIVIHDGEVFDPGVNEGQVGNWRITSYLEIRL